MALQIKTFRITDPSGEEAVNTFLSNKRVHHWEATYSGDPALGVWNLFVAFEDEQRRFDRPMRSDRQDRPERHDRPEARRAPAEPKVPRVEHTPPDVPEAMMPLYENIRKWRNQVARDEKIKPYILFNNKQLEDLVKAPPAAIDSLKQITTDMSGELFEKYGNQLLGLIAASGPAEAAQ